MPHFTSTNISFTLPPSLQHATIKFFRIRKLSEFKITAVYSRKAVHRKTSTRQFLIWWKNCIPYCLYWHPSKSSCLAEIYVSTDKIYSNKEMMKKDFASKYFFEVNVVLIRTNPLQWSITCWRVYFLSLL